MTARLVGMQVLGIALLVSGTLAFLLHAISGHLEADNRDDLENQAALLRNWLEQPIDNTSDLKQQISARVGGYVGTQLFFIRILDERGVALVETTTTIKPPITAFPAPGQKAVFWHLPGHPHYVMTAVQINHLGASNQQAQLQIAFDVTDDTTLVRHIRQSSSIVFVFALLSSAGLAWLITRKALQPLTTLTKSAKRVQATRLDTRLETTDWPIELAELVREFDAMLGRLDSSFRRLVHFSADLSHELRTPINNLRGEAEVALNRLRTPEEYRAVLESSLEEYSRITRLIDTLLFIAKADQPQHGILLQQLDASTECRAVVDYFEDTFSERGVTLLIRGTAKICCDSGLFRRALSNLIDNALRYTPSGGHIDLIVRTGSSGDTEVEVSDTGSGIAAEHLPHLLERFYQVGKNENNVTAHSSGFGLGLAIVKSIMDLHGGRIAIASAPERGTTITLYFPAQPPETKAS